jgi:hypothetical protein
MEAWKTKRNKNGPNAGKNGQPVGRPRKKLVDGQLVDKRGTFVHSLNFF